MVASSASDNNAEIRSKCLQAGFEYYHTMPVKLDFFKRLFAEVERRQSIYSDLAIDSGSISEQSGLLK